MQESEAQLALIGVTPTYPSSKYGYIVPSEKRKQVKRITFQLTDLQKNQ